MSITEEEIKALEAEESKIENKVEEPKPKSKSQKRRLDIQTGKDTVIEKPKLLPEEEIAKLQADIAELTIKKDVDSANKLADDLKEKAKAFQTLASPKKEVEKIDKIEEEKDSKLFVSIDFSPEMVVSYYKEGKELYFESDVGRFRPLDDEIVDGFDKLTRTRYVNSFYLNKKAIEQLKAPASGIKYSGRLASATASLQIDNKKPGMHYAWIAPGEMRERVYEGSRVCEDPDIITLHSNDGSSHRVEALGQTELVLMETPKEIANARMKKISDASIARKGGVVEQGIQQLRRGGHKSFDPIVDEDPRRHSFGSINRKPSEEE